MELWLSIPTPNKDINSGYKDKNIPKKLDTNRETANIYQNKN